MENDIPALPTSFEWVYIYIDSKTKEVGYVGRAKNAKRCARRICEHRSDKWYYSTIWNLAFYPCINRYESETIETVFVNMYNAKFNKDKKGWGLPLDYEGPKLSELKTLPESQMNIAGVSMGLIEYENAIKKEMINSGNWRK